MNCLARLSFSIFLLGIITSCSISRQSVSGFYLYKIKNNPEIWEALHLKPDGSFDYQFSNSMVPYPKLTGDWKLRHDSVILNSKGYSVLYAGDTLKLKNAVYFAEYQFLKRKTSGGGRINLRKIKKLTINDNSF